MNRNSSIALFGAVFAVSIGLMGSNGVFSMPTSISTTGTNYHENAGNMLGHVTLVAQDPSGNIKEYRQLDNVVTNIGRSCTSADLFGTAVTSGSVSCFPRAAGFQYIGIGTATRTEVTSDTGLDAYVPNSPPQARTIFTLTNSTGATGGIAVQTTSFLFGPTAPYTIGEANLQDSTATNLAGEHTFARKAISPTIGVNSGDTLTVTWTITTG